jgi:glycosyltransferase involved in cell wall biosynthesis
MLRVLEHLPGPAELIVIDDGSQDKTAAIAAEVDGVKVLRHRSNCGYGASLKTGIRYARYPLICITDADGTYPNERIPDLLKGILQRGADMVVGARVSENVTIPLVRRPAKWMIRQLSQIISNEKIPDINSGLRIFKRSVALRFFSILPSTFSFTITITLAMVTNGYRVEYVPVDYFHRVGRSKIKPIRDTINFVNLILRMALYFAPIKIFMPMSFTLFILGLAWGLVSRLAFGRVADASMAVIMTSSVQVAAIGLLANMIDQRMTDYTKPEERIDSERLPDKDAG